MVKHRHAYYFRGTSFCCDKIVCDSQSFSYAPSDVKAIYLMSIKPGVLVQSTEPEAHDNVLDDNPDRITLEMLVFEERGKPEYPDKNLS